MIGPGGRVAWRGLRSSFSSGCLAWLPWVFGSGGLSAKSRAEYRIRPDGLVLWRRADFPENCAPLFGTMLRALLPTLCVATKVASYEIIEKRV